MEERYEIFNGETISLPLGDGGTLVCDVLTIFAIGEQEYIVLAPQEEVEGGNVLFFRISEDEEGSIVLDNIPTDEEFDLVAQTFEEHADELLE